MRGNAAKTKGPREALGLLSLRKTYRGAHAHTDKQTHTRRSWYSPMTCTQERLGFPTTFL